MEYVYFFRHNNSPYVKIGRTMNDIKLRFSEFKVYAPLGAYIVGSIKTENSNLLEKKLHNKFKNERVKGEFFKLTDEDVYFEIKTHNPSFGNVIFKLNKLIESHDIALDEVIKILDIEISKRIIDNDNEKGEFQPILNFIEKNKGVRLTPTEICDQINKNGYNYNVQFIGRLLKNNLGYEKKIIRQGDKTKAFYIL